MRNSCPSLHSYQQRARVPGPPVLMSTYLVLYVLLVILNEAATVCVSLGTGDAEHTFMSVLVPVHSCYSDVFS